MIKILSSFEDKAVYEIVDTAKFDFENDVWAKPVREVILLSDIIEEFKNKSGKVFDYFHYTDRFKELLELINKNKSERLYYDYEDSWNEFIEKWPKYHPNETYEEYEKRINKDELKRYEKCYSAFGDPYFNYLPYTLTNYNY